jgi:hypothetical protein
MLSHITLRAQSICRAPEHNESTINLQPSCTRQHSERGVNLQSQHNESTLKVQPKHSDKTMKMQPQHGEKSYFTPLKQSLKSVVLLARTCSIRAFARSAPLEILVRDICNPNRLWALDICSVAAHNHPRTTQELAHC